MKTVSIIIIFILIIVLGFVTGMYMYRINKLDKEIQKDTLVSSKVDDECTAISELAELRYVRFGNG